MSRRSGESARHRCKGTARGLLNSIVALFKTTLELRKEQKSTTAARVNTNLIFKLRSAANTCSKVFFFYCFIFLLSLLLSFFYFLLLRFVINDEFLTGGWHYEMQIIDVFCFFVSTYKSNFFPLLISSYVISYYLIILLFICLFC